LFYHKQFCISLPRDRLISLSKEEVEEVVEEVVEEEEEKEKRDRRKR
jgi:hypothetical protein